MTSIARNQVPSSPAQSRPRVSLGSTLLPFMALGVLFLVLLARAAVDPEVVPSAQADLPSPVASAAIP